MKSTWIIILCSLSVIQNSQAWRRFRRPVCDPVKCGPNCREVSNPRGCPACLCEIVPECAVPLCGPGCKVETEFKGPCPGCDCDIEDDANLDQRKPMCSPPLCPPGCEIEKDFKGPCPGCKCENEGKDEEVINLEERKPMCSPPLCPPGCEIEKDFQGPCPGCKCDSGDKDEDDIKFEMLRPMCSPPLCPPGCEIETEFQGPCPGCKCENEGKEEDVKMDCPPDLECGGSCKIERDENGCKKCVCKPECSIPLCQPGCFIKNRPGRCPFCYCDKRWSRKH